jgi:hypothetical protein
MMKKISETNSLRRKDIVENAGHLIRLITNEPEQILSVHLLLKDKLGAFTKSISLNWLDAIRIVYKTNAKIEREEKEDRKKCEKLLKQTNTK